MTDDTTSDLRPREAQILQLRDHGFPWDVIAQSEQTSEAVCRNLHQQAEQKRAGAECGECGRSVSDHPLGHDNLLNADGDDAFGGEYVCRDCVYDANGGDDGE